VYYGGAGSGKSIFVVQKILIKLLNNSNRKCLVCRQVGRTLRDSIFQNFIDALSEFKIYEYCKINNTNMTITLPNKSVLLFKGLDDPNKIKSITGIDDIVIEEADQINGDAFDELDNRLRSLKPYNQIHLMFNPMSKLNWTYKRFFSGDVSDDTVIIKSTYKDNRFLPLSYHKRMENLINYNQAYYKVYVLGDFATLDKLVIPKYKVISRMDFNKIKISNNAMRLGIDFGFTNDPTTIIAMYYSKLENTLYICQEIAYKTGLLNKDINLIIKRTPYANCKITADCAEPKSIAELKSHGLNIQGSKKGADSIMHGITFLNSVKIVVVDDCKNVINELDNYVWDKDKKSGEYINKPIDKYNHSIDAIRYGIEDIIINRMNRATGRLIKDILEI
jgi:phage terminase large subunit